MNIFKWPCRKITNESKSGDVTYHGLFYSALIKIRCVNLLQKVVSMMTNKSHRDKK